MRDTRLLLLLFDSDKCFLLSSLSCLFWCYRSEIAMKSESYCVVAYSTKEYLKNHKGIMEIVC